jgi:hypothetical protein
MAQTGTVLWQDNSTYNMFSANTTQISTTSETVVADPYFATNTVFLQNYDNIANGTSVISPDVTTKATFTNTGVTISTAVKKYGTGSGSLNGSSSYLAINSNANFGMGSSPFTVEFWMYPTNVAGDRGIFGFHGTGTDHYWGILINATGKLKTWYRQTTQNNVTGNTTLVANTWYHVAVVRTSDTVDNNLRIYLNGVPDGGRLMTGTENTFSIPTTTAVLGRTYYDNSQQYFAGYLDDVRVTKGIARYTTLTSFTPPTGPFATS